MNENPVDHVLVHQYAQPAFYSAQDVAVLFLFGP